MLSVGDVDEICNVSIEEDKMSYVKDARNSIVSDIPNHVDIKEQLLVDHVQKGEIVLQYV